MDMNMDNLKRFLENVRSVGLWRRVFGWRHLRNQLIDASTDLERFLANYQREKEQAATAAQRLADLGKDLELSVEETRKKQTQIDLLQYKANEDTSKILSLTTDLTSANTSLKSEQQRSSDLNTKNEVLAQKNEHFAGEVKRLSDQVLLFEKDEEDRKQEHDSQMATLKQYQDRIQKDRDEEKEAQHSAELQRLENLKSTWMQHQENVKQTMKTLCSKHTIDYIDKVAFKGDPDNTLSICGEFVVFDAKSPKGEDLSNFPTYLKDQAEKAKKYASVENVKKWVFFVVPVNALDVVKTFVYHLADYQVFVITVDALEPIVLCLKKIEEYQFAEQLSPDERENICRILGKFAHLSKRRVQVDAFFINQFMELAYKCESDLPSDVLDKAIEFERAERLNPPQEKRAKAIAMSELEKTVIKIHNDASNKGIALENGGLTEGLNGVPLYRAE